MSAELRAQKAELVAAAEKAGTTTPDKTTPTPDLKKGELPAPLAWAIFISSTALTAFLLFKMVASTMRPQSPWTD